MLKDERLVRVDIGKLFMNQSNIKESFFEILIIIFLYKNQLGEK